MPGVLELGGAGRVRGAAPRPARPPRRDVRDLPASENASGGCGFAERPRVRSDGHG